MEDVKEEIRMKIVHPFAQPELFAAYGKTPGGGILLYGPPGCGKTYIARATAGEISATFIAIGIDEVLSMWMGESEQALHEAFERARRAAPCVLFFDEVDAIGAKRHDIRHGAMRQLVNQFLAELDGIKTSNEGVLVLAATNAPWAVDAALRRPGASTVSCSFRRRTNRQGPRFSTCISPRGRRATSTSNRLQTRRTGFPEPTLLRSSTEPSKPSCATRCRRASLCRSRRAISRRRRGARPTTAEWMQTARSYALHATRPAHTTTRSHTSSGDE